MVKKNKSSLELQWRCPKCLDPNTTEPAGDGLGPWNCDSCDENFSAQPDAKNPEGEIVACPRCGCRDIYRQRDFNRAVGIGIIVIGAIFAPFTYYLSLIVCGLIDMAIFTQIGDIVICYHCQSIMRGYKGTEKVAAFDLNVSDKYIEVERERGWK